MGLRKLKIHERKLNQSKETSIDFLTYITRLPNLVFAELERTSQIRDEFIPGKPTFIRLNVLMQPKTTTVCEFCASVSKCPKIENIRPDKGTQATGFNSFAENI